MHPAMHREWLRDEVAAIRRAAVDHLDDDVPSCPGWTVADVLGHLAVGLGVAYPLAVRADPHATSGFGDEALPEPPSGDAALEAYDRHLADCQAIFGSVQPEHRCWTYAGPGVAAFWFRRAAIETSLHRTDVEEAVSGDRTPLPLPRAVEVVREAGDFALPMACEVLGLRPPPIAVELTDARGGAVLGEGEPVARLIGEAADVALALWGRSDRFEITGDETAVAAWLTSAERAFARSG